MTTAPSIITSDALFASFVQLRPGATKDDFYKFLTSPSADRNAFLTANCESSYAAVENLAIHKLR